MRENSMTDTLTVFIEEEYGYRYWIWKFKGTRDELLAWWTSLESVIPFFFNPFNPSEGMAKLGTMTELEDDCVIYDDKGGYTIDKEKEAKWLEATFAENYSFAMHIHGDDDSSLYDRETDKIFHHAGWGDNFDTKCGECGKCAEDK